MNKPTIRFAVTISALGSVIVPVALLQASLPACLSSSPPGGATSSSSSSSSSGSTSSGGDSGGSTQTDCKMLPIDPGNSACIIDDMTGQTVASGGYWYTYSDRTVPNTSNVVDAALLLDTNCSGQPATAGMGCVVATPDGTITPPEGAQFPPSSDTSGGPMVGNISQAFREFTASGLTLWGAGMGFNWTNVIPADAGMSDAADAGPVLGVPGNFDASAHLGIAFWGKSNSASSVAISVHLSDVREAVAGGQCDPTILYNSPKECGDDFFEKFTLPANTWKQFHLLFSDVLLTTQNYTMMGLQHIDPTHLYQVHFQYNNSNFAGNGAVMPSPMVDFSIAYVTWYDGT